MIGTVIGSGIFLVPQEMIRQVGSPAMVFAVWVFGGLLSLGGALTYAEMAAAMPEAGGEYVYLREAYGPFWGYIYGWTQMWVAKSGSIATLATGFLLLPGEFFPAPRWRPVHCRAADRATWRAAGNPLRPIDWPWRIIVVLALD